MASHRAIQQLDNNRRQCHLCLPHLACTSHRGHRASIQRTVSDLLCKPLHTLLSPRLCGHIIHLPRHHPSRLYRAAQNLPAKIGVGYPQAPQIPCVTHRCAKDTQNRTCITFTNRVFLLHHNTLARTHAEAHSPTRILLLLVLLHLLTALYHNLILMVSHVRFHKSPPHLRHPNLITFRP